MRSGITIFVSVLLSALVSFMIVNAKQPSAQKEATTATKNESAYQRVLRTGKIRCGYGISPPNLIKDVNTGQLSGLDYELWQEIGKELGLKIEWAEEAGWGNFIEGLRSGRYDAFCSQLWPDPARTKFLTMAGPVIYSPLFAFVRTDDKRYDGAFDKINSAETTIPGIDGDVGISLVQENFPNAHVLVLPQTNTVSDMLLSVVTKKADLVFLNNAMFHNFDQTNPGQLRRAKNLPPALLFASYLGMNNGEYALRDMINLALRKMIDDGRLEKIAKKYDTTAIVAKKGM